MLLVHMHGHLSKVKEITLGGHMTILYSRLSHLWPFEKRNNLWLSDIYEFPGGSESHRWWLLLSCIVRHT